MRVLIFAACLTLMGCTDANGARKVLAQEGHTEIAIGGYDFFGCSKDDTFATTFTAVNAHGKRVRGVVCSGSPESSA